MLLGDKAGVDAEQRAVPMRKWRSGAKAKGNDKISRGFIFLAGLTSVSVYHDLKPPGKASLLASTLHSTHSNSSHYFSLTVASLQS